MGSLEGDVEYRVSLQRVNEQRIAACRQRTNNKMVSKEIQPLLGRVWTFFKDRPGLQYKGRNIAIYWQNTPGGSVEVGVEVIRSFEETDEVVPSSTPECDVAMTTHWGQYSGLGGAHNAIREWCAANGCEIMGPFWEIYGHWDDDWAKVRTDVLYRLK